MKLSQIALKHGTEGEILSIKNLIQSQVNRVTSQSGAERLVDAVEEAIRNASWDSNHQNMPELSPKGLWLPDARQTEGTIRTGKKIDSFIKKTLGSPRD